MKSDVAYWRFRAKVQRSLAKGAPDEYVAAVHRALASLMDQYAKAEIAAPAECDHDVTYH